MKKYRIICLALLLSLLLSSSAFALGNDFTFGVDWFNSVIQNTLINETKSNGQINSYIVQNSGYLARGLRYVKFGGNLVGGIDTPEPFVFWAKTTSDVERFSFKSPINVKVRNGQTLNITTFLMLDSQRYDYNLNIANGAEVRFMLSDGTAVVGVSTKKSYASAEIGEIIYNTSGFMAGFESDYTGTGNMLISSWTNTTGEDVTVSYIVSNWTFQYWDYYYSGNFYFGFFAESENEVLLPSYVEEQLVNISNELSQGNIYLENILTELEDVKAELINVSQKLDSSGGNTNNYYQTITQSTEEQIVKQEQLDELVATARSELEEMKEVIQSVTVPTASDVSSATTSQATQMTIDDSLSNATINNVLGKLFENTTLVTMMLSCISIATVGYILYGKRS